LTPSVSNDKVQVRVENGSVSLSGQVDWNYQRSAAGSAVHRLHGIKGIYNNITIQPHVQRSDVKNRIETALKRNAELEASKIRVSVTGDKVMLDGDVKTWGERYAAEPAFRQMDFPHSNCLRADAHALYLLNLARL
jgi:osmotically-inducible protein OsmY